jgi:hypothetical protein
LLKSRLCCDRVSVIEMPWVAAVFMMIFISWYAGQMSLSDSWDWLRQFTQLVLQWHFFKDLGVWSTSGGWLTKFPVFSAYERVSNWQS